MENAPRPCNVLHEGSATFHGWTKNGDGELNAVVEDRLGNVKLIYPTWIKFTDQPQMKTCYEQ